MAENETGGYLIPKVYYFPKPGIIAYIKRLLNIKSGWIETHPFDEIIAAMKNIRAR